MKLYFQLGGGGRAPSDTVRKFGIKPRMRCGSRLSRGMGLPLASRGWLELGLVWDPSRLVSDAVGPGCRTSGDKVKFAGPPKSAGAAYSPESASEPVAAIRLADGSGASGSSLALLTIDCGPGSCERR